MKKQRKKNMPVEQIQEPVLDDPVVEIAVAVEAPVQNKRNGSISYFEAFLIFLMSFGLMGMLMGITWGVIESLTPPPSLEQIQLQQQVEDIYHLYTDNSSAFIAPIAPIAPSLNNTAVVSSNIVKDQPVFYASEEFQQEFEALLDKHQAKLQKAVPLSGHDQRSGDGTDAQQ